MEYIIWNEPLVSEARRIELKYTLDRYCKDGKYFDTSSAVGLIIDGSLGLVEEARVSLENASKIKIGDEEGLYIDKDKPEIIYVDSSAENPLTYHFFFENRDLKDTILSLIENMQ